MFRIGEFGAISVDGVPNGKSRIILFAMFLPCPNCAGIITAQDLNPESFLLARCPHCENIISFHDPSLPGLENTGWQMSAEDVRPISCPQRFCIDEKPGDWSVKFRWFTSDANLLAALCFSVGAVSLVLTSALISERPLWIYWVVPIFFDVITVIVAYILLALALNTTTIRVTRSGVEVRSGPVPFTSPRKAFAPAGRVKRFAALPYGGRRDSSPRRDLWALSATLNDGLTITFLKGFRRASELFYLQRELEARLQVPPMPLQSSYIIRPGDLPPALANLSR